MAQLPCYCEIEPPALEEIFRLTDINKSFAEYWPHIMCIHKSAIDEDILYVIAKGRRGQIYLYQFAKGCYSGKRDIKISYSMSSPITSLSSSLIAYKNINKQSCYVSYLFIGYQSGQLDVYTIQEQDDDQPIILQKKISVQTNIPKPMPIIKIELCNNTLIICYTYMVIFIKQIFQTKNYKEINPQAAQKKMDFRDMPYHLNIHSSSQENIVYFYNQINGSMCFDLTAWKSTAKINDTIRYLALLPKHLMKYPKIVGESESTVILGTMDNSLKFVDYNLNTIFKFVGYKNYPNCCFLQNFPEKPPILWVGALDGTLSCFSINRKAMSHKKSEQEFGIQSFELKYVRKICEGGIVNIYIHNQLLIIKDTEYNITFYDILTYSNQVDTSISNQSEQS